MYNVPTREIIANILLQYQIIVFRVAYYFGRIRHLLRVAVAFIVGMKLSMQMLFNIFIKLYLLNNSDHSYFWNFIGMQ